MLEKKFNLIIVFGLIAYTIYCFNKNMIVVLGISLIITFISTLGMKVKEGLENNKNTPTKSPSQKKESNIIVPPKLSEVSVPNTTPSTNIPEAKLPTTESMNLINRKKGRFDENAASVEDTYNDINKLLENSAGSNLNIDTKQLLEQQAQLTEAMKNMAPLIESAKSLMNGMNFDGLNNLASSLVSKK